MSESSISLKITLPNKISFYVEMENCDYISDLKEKCSQITSIPSESMNLIYENRILLNENQIKYYKFEKDKEIYLQSNSKNLITEKSNPKEKIKNDLNLTEEENQNIKDKIGFQNYIRWQEEMKTGHLSEKTLMELFNNEGMKILIQRFVGLKDLSNFNRPELKVFTKKLLQAVLP